MTLVFVMPLSGVNATAVLAGLDRCAGFLQGRLARDVSLRFAPRLVFTVDPSFDEAARILRLLALPEVQRDLRPGVIAALDADEGEKRDLIARLIDRPLAGIFGEFAALQGSELNAALRRGDFGYRAFVLTPAHGR